MSSHVILLTDAHEAPAYELIEAAHIDGAGSFTIAVRIVIPLQRYVIALAARVVREVADLVRRSTEQAKQLATLSIDTEIRFRSPVERAAFSNELTGAVAKLVARYHDASAPGGRAHRLVVVAHPLPGKAGK